MGTVFRSTKLFEGFSTCFRQWRAEGTHCKFLHGYGVSFRVWFEGELDHRNWVWDFGGMKRATAKIDNLSPAEFFNYYLDHTVIVAKDDPYLETFIDLGQKGLIQLRVVNHVGAERFAEFLFARINEFLKEETSGRVKAVKLEFYENDRNSAIVVQDQ